MNNAQKLFGGCDLKRDTVNRVNSFYKIRKFKNTVIYGYVNETVNDFWAIMPNNDDMLIELKWCGEHGRDPVFEEHDITIKNFFKGLSDEGNMINTSNKKFNYPYWRETAEEIDPLVKYTGFN